MSFSQYCFLYLPGAFEYQPTNTVRRNCLFCLYFLPSRFCGGMVQGAM